MDAATAQRTQGYTDIREDSWIDRWAPRGVRPYLRLARLDRPIGTWLLLFPGWWSIALAADTGWPNWYLMLLFGIGAILMRGAGCTVNDILDRDIDGRVERTRFRPIPSGQVSVRQAAVFVVLQSLAAFLILLQLSNTAIWLGVLSLALVAAYPLMKRITWWPQAFLGLTFNWGALMGWAAVTDSLTWAPVWLYVGGIFWTLGYDTIYAHQDRDDDARIGVKSTALLFGDHARSWINSFYFAAAICFAFAGASDELGGIYFVFLGAAFFQMLWQCSHWLPDDRADCLAKFRSNRTVGWLLLAGIIFGSLPSI